MRVVLQRVSQAQVVVDDQTTGKIDHGFVILLGIGHEDGQEDIDWLVNKIAGLRVFGDEEGKMNNDLISINGSILLISQFTLHASTKKGKRPSFIHAARPEVAIPLYEDFQCALRAKGVHVETGEFGADMKVSLTNDGPVTIIIDSKHRQ